VLRARLVALLVVALLPMRAIPGQQQGSRAVAATPLPPVATALRPGDRIRVEIWREEELSDTAEVDEHGVAVLPGLGRIQVSDRDAEQVIADIVRAYERIVVHTSISVIPLRRIQVLGAVRTPGLYHADPTMTLGEVLGLAGGASAQGRTDRLELLRDGKRLPVRFTSETLVANAALSSGDQIYVPERSWISRNPGVAVAIVSTALSLALAFSRSR
jgi:polysaccharide export outer membrane protein